MRVLAACSVGGVGHLIPLVPFLAAAARRGDQTLVVGPAALEDTVRSAGYRFHVGGEPPESEVAAIRERLPIAPPGEATVLGNRELFGRLATTAMLPTMERICTEWSPDLILRETCEYASAVVGPDLGITTVQAAISLAGAESASIEAAAPALEAWRRGLVEELMGAPYLSSFPESLDPTPFSSTVRVRDPGGRPTTPSSDPWGGATAPLVWATFGTVLGGLPTAGGVYRTVVKAFAGLPETHVLLTVGRQFDPSELGPVPAHVRVEPWVDQHRVVERADLVVCHGGSGTVLGALAAGKPLVVVPSFADQFENGRRIAAAGAGVVVEETGRAIGAARTPLGEQDAPRIERAITTVLGEPSYRRRAERFAVEMEAYPTVDLVLDRLLTGGSLDAWTSRPS